MKTQRSPIRRRVLFSLAGLLIASLGADRPDPPASQPTTQKSPTTQLAGFNRALIVPIRGMITDVTFNSIQRRLKRVDEGNFDLVIFEMDTPGGILGTTLDICDAIFELRDNGIKTYAWINTDAYSAGTIIALATDGIVMARNATIGDCMPIMIIGGTPSAVDEDIEPKLLSPLLEKLEESIRRSRYDYDMVMAFIRPEVVMFWVENTQTGEKRFVEPHERNRLFGIDPEDRGGGLLNLFGRGEPKESVREPIPDSESKTDWRYVKEVPGYGEVRQPIVTDRNLLTMHTRKATAYGFSLATLIDEDDIRRHFNVTGVIERAENNWFEAIIEWLASPTIRGILFLLLMLGAYAEFQAPGFGVPGIVALVALILFLGAPYLAGITVEWEIVAIILGLLLIALEVFVIPGFGVAGILGTLLLVTGLLFSFVPPELGRGDWQPYLPSMEMSYKALARGLYSLLGGMTGSFVCMYFLAKYFRRIPVAGRIIAANPAHANIMMDDPYGGAAQVGDIGRSESLLRPAGKARFGALLVDVVSEGEYIQKGVRVEVIERAGNRVVVRHMN